MRNVLFSLLLLLLCSCTPQQRLSRLVDRHPELVRDSLVVLSMQAVLPGWSFDDLLPLPKQGRQIPFTDERHGLSGTLTLGDSSIGIHIEKEPDTVSIDTALNVPTVVVQPARIKKDNRVLFAIIITAGGCLLFVILSRK